MCAWGPNFLFFVGALGPGFFLGGGGGGRGTGLLTFIFFFFVGVPGTFVFFGGGGEGDR
jgi:hypothetical protein